MATIKDSKLDLERALSGILRSLLPQTDGYAVKVDILEDHRKKRSDASRESWTPAKGQILITFPGPAVADTGQEAPAPATGHDNGPSQESNPPEAGHDPRSWRVGLIVSLDTAEHRPDFNFVSLKWFRDLFLPAEGHDWLESQAARQELIRDAIENGIILTSKVPNPKTPAFPVTAIRLNRRHPEVIAALGEKGAPLSDFEPVDIMGEPLSTTVLTDRR